MEDQMIKEEKHRQMFSVILLSWAEYISESLIPAPYELTSDIFVSKMCHRAPWMQRMTASS